MQDNTDFATFALDDFHDAALRLLAEGVEDPHHALHTLTLATLSAEGAPRVRSIIPRGIDKAARRLQIHTDSRSAKIGELRRDPRASVLGYDAGTRLQIRLEGRCDIHQADAAARLGWNEARPASRQIYRIAPAPGTLVAAEDEVAPEHFDEAAGFGNFAMITLLYDVMDALFLGKARHRRVRADWKSGRRRLSWVAP